MIGTTDAAAGTDGVTSSDPVGVVILLVVVMVLVVVVVSCSVLHHVTSSVLHHVTSSVLHSICCIASAGSDVVCCMMVYVLTVCMELYCIHYDAPYATTVLLHTLLASW